MPADEIHEWFFYAEENLAAARVLLDAGYLNPCLHEAQQAAEKALKTIVLAKRMPLKKTHSIREIKAILFDAGVELDVSNDDCMLMDSIYLPSKYPLGSSLPECEPDKEICSHCIDVAHRAVNMARRVVEALGVDE